MSIFISFSKNCPAGGSALWMNSAGRDSVVPNINSAEEMALSSFRPQAKQHPWKMIRPFRVGLPDPQSGLQLAMASLNHGIALRMVGSGVDGLHSQHLV
jgi:hypothetical protein